MTRIFCAAALAATLGLTLGSSATRGDPILRWSEAASAAAAASGMAPLRTPITLALVHVAMDDAVTAVSGNRRPDAVGTPAGRPASAYAAAVEAGYRVLIAEFPAQEPVLRGTYEALLAHQQPSEKRESGRAIGADVAQRLLAARASDGRNTVVRYEAGAGPGVWIPTPPRFLDVSTAFLATTTPFTMESPGQFRPAGPPALKSRKWQSDYDEVKSLGGRDGSQRTAEQTATALFWEPLAGTVWIPTIRRLARQQALDLEASARFQAAAFAAYADGLIACWDAKFHFNFWRPVTAIHGGGTDGHPGTIADPAWEPFATTPNFPEYPSGHACASAAVAHTIEAFFGSRHVPIPARNVVSGEERVYRHASDLVDEVVEARMLLGLHFRTGDEDGAEIGRRIARQIQRDWLRARPRRTGTR